MDKDIKEILKELKKLKTTMEKITEKDLDEAKSKFEEKLKESLNEPCKISIEKDKGGQARCMVEGERLALLITFIALKKAVMSKLHTSNEELEFLEHFIGSEEVE